MGYIAHLRNQFKSINTYDCIISLMKRKKYALFPKYELNGWNSIWRNFNARHPKMLCAKFGKNWPSASIEKDNFANVFLLFF